MIGAIQRHVPVGALRFGRPAGGLYLWCRLGTGVSAVTLLERALSAGVAFVAGPAFYADPAGDSELRLCFTSVLPAAMDESIRKLASCLVDAQRLTPSAESLAIAR
jgi:2-aminoadipate transaminase